MTFLKTVLIILLGYYALRLLWSLVRPYFMRWLQRKAQRHFAQAFGQEPFREPSRQKEGEVSIDRMPRPRSKKKANVGQYIDFEEID